MWENNIYLSPDIHSVGRISGIYIFSFWRCYWRFSLLENYITFKKIQYTLHQHYPLLGTGASLAIQICLYIRNTPDIHIYTTYIQKITNLQFYPRMSLPRESKDLCAKMKSVQRFSHESVTNRQSAF